jgi:hypothetical protein
MFTIATVGVAVRRSVQAASNRIPARVPWRREIMVEESFYRPAEIAREARTMRADTYSLAFLLLKRSGKSCVFVPIRSMQYLGVIDAEEIVFVHREGRRMIELAWQRFRPQDRTSLDEPVPFDVVYYGDDAAEVMYRLPWEFHQALLALDKRQSRDRRPGRLIPFPSGGS